MDAVIVTFKTVSGFSDGPKKPTSSTINGTSQEVTAGITSALLALSELGSGEVMQIIVNG